jgi:ABC-type Mn2+/Zn2+ transport system permease subunit/Mn-dependent DtxR family transcriptional regulator
MSHLDQYPLMWAATWDSAGWWIIATGAVTNLACAGIGCLLVLRRMSLMGDAIAHAVLPGLAVAFLISGTYAIGPLFLGAAAAGLAAALLTQTLHQYARVPTDASMGVVFTTMFAVGVVLIRQIKGVHFDVQCVYAGALELAPLARVEVGGWQVPRAMVITGVAWLVNTAVLTALWKEWKVSSFDPALSTTMGFSATRLHYLLMVLVAATTVACFEAVGSILVVAMLIVPASTAHLLTDRLSWMMVLSSLVAVAASLLGYLVGDTYRVSVSGAMTVVAGVMFLAAVMFSPTHGVIRTFVANLRMTLRIAREDLLAMLYRAEEEARRSPLSLSDACRALGGGWVPRVAVSGMVRQGWVERRGDALRLTERGERYARKLVRSHRLWETYLVEEVGLATDHVHEPAHRVEHYIDEGLQRKLQEQIETPGEGGEPLDPHGREIPQ